MSKLTFTRRQALESLGIVVASSTLARGEEFAGQPPVRLAPVDELVDVPEFEEQAKRKLPKATFAAIAGSEREAFDRMTFQPRYMVETMDMDLSMDLFGNKLVAPVLIGATPQQKRFHPDAELATARGASAGRTLLVVSSQSSVPIAQIAAQTTAGIWYQVSAEANVASVRAQIQQAIEAGCKAIFISVEPGTEQTQPRPNWVVIEQLRKGISVPILVNGIMMPEDGKEAVQRGIQGIVVTSTSVPVPSGRPAAIEVLPSIVDAVDGKSVVLVGGSIRWGTDVLKALALGAKAVLVGRPVMWGLAAYGADGVQTVAEILQNDLARHMAACGNVNLASIPRDLVKIHARRASKA